MAGGGQRGPLFLLDGSNVAYRAFFALPEGIATSGGFPTNALYGFCLMVIKILSEYHPDSVIVAEGIAPGDTVVTAGVQTLRAGQKVRILGAGS